MKLTEREKALLFVLGLIILAVGGVYFVLIPTLKSYQEAKVSLEESMNKQMEAELLLERAVSIDGQLEMARLEADDASQPFLQELDPEYIDTWIHKMAEGTGVEITRNTMSEPTVAVPQIYTPGQTVLTYPIKDYFRDSQPQEKLVEEEQKAESASETSDVGAEIIQVTVQLGVIGSQDQLLSLIDKLAKSGVYLRVEHFTLGAEETQLSLTLYMIEKVKDQELNYPFTKPNGRDLKL